MTENTENWSDWTSAGPAANMRKIWAEIEQVKKWQRTHLGIDFMASGVDYPHPSQKIRSLYFFEGNGRLDSTGIQIVADTDILTPYTNRGIYWVLEYSDTPLLAVPLVYVSGGIKYDSLNDAYNQELFLGATSRDDGQASLRVSSGDVNSGHLNGFIFQAADGTTSTIVNFGVGVGRNSFWLVNTPLHLEGVTSDFTLGLADGMLWYRSDTDKFRARINGATQNLATEAYVASSAPSHVPVVTKTANYVATSSDTFIACDATSGSFTVIIPNAVSNPGLRLTIKKTNAANTVSIDPSQNIDGSGATIPLTVQWSARTIVSDGSNWLIESAYL